MGKIVINIDEIIMFYDLKGENHKYASSITALIGEDLISGIFKHFLQGLNYNSEVIILPENPKEKNGKWLDRWIIQKIENAVTCYQTEIKNWSAHSLGGKHFDYIKNSYLSFDISESNKIFAKTWDSNKQEFQDPSVNKVLKKMKANDTIERYTQKTIEPLVCFWMPITRNSVIEPIIEINIDDKIQEFKKVTIFSASIYLRKLKSSGIDNIEIEPGSIIKRMKKLNDLFTIENI
jgi:hypothetical protein